MMTDTRRLSQLVESVVNLSDRPVTLAEVLSATRSWSPEADAQAIAHAATTSRQIRRATVRAFGQKLQLFAPALPA